MKLAPVSVVILSFNSKETICNTVSSILGLTDDIHIIDSGSVDGTIQLLSKLPVKVHSREFKGYSEQRNWAISNLDLKYDWQLHLDADESVSNRLLIEIRSIFHSDVEADLVGYYIPRLVIFQGQPIRHGGMWPIFHMRLFHKDFGLCEERKYDQHFYVKGKAGQLGGPMIDDIRMSLSEWTSRHNRWADLEVEEALNPTINEVIQPGITGPVQVKRLYRAAYNNLPILLRAFLLFFYRYILKRGFLDGKWGLIFFVLQTFWFRFLIDAKIIEAKQSSNKTS